jgi:hypothetical protein
MTTGPVRPSWSWEVDDVRRVNFAAFCETLLIKLVVLDSDTALAMELPEELPEEKPSEAGGIGGAEFWRALEVEVSEEGTDDNRGDGAGRVCGPL